MWLFLATFVAFISRNAASIAGISCQSSNLCVNTVPFLLLPPICLQTTIFPCSYDVQVFHGANNGQCNNDFNCIAYYTGGQGSNADGGITGLIVNNCNAQNFTLCQCSSDQLGSDITSAYRQFCDFDCRCDHGGVSGTCDFTNRKCICNYGISAWTSSECPEFSPGGLNLSGLSIQAAYIVNSFCTLTLPLIDYQATYCTPVQSTLTTDILSKILSWLTLTSQSISSTLTTLLG